MSSRPCRFLLIDVSNSFTKIALADGDSEILEVKRIATKELCETALRGIAGRRRFNTCVFCSVVPSKNEAIRSFSREARIVEVKAGMDLGVTIDMPDPGGVGADRLANAAFAAARCKLPVVIVDIGTAATFDVILPGKRFVGGVIAPGPDLMSGYMHERTALLPEIELREPERAIGKSTAEAMLAGAVFGYRGMIRGILDRIRSEIFEGNRVRVIGTGGGAELVREVLTDVIPNLTLEGLCLIGQRP